MGVIGLIGSIIGIIKFGIQIYQLVSEILELIGKLKGQEQEAAAVELKAAVEHYKANKDRRRLLGLRDRLRKRCFGDQCPQ